MPFLPLLNALGARLYAIEIGSPGVASAGDGSGEMSKVPGRRDSAQSGAAMGMSLAFEFAAAVFMFWLVGRLVDGWLGIEPWGQVTGSVVGWVGGVAHVYYAVQSRSDSGRRAGS